MLFYRRAGFRCFMYRCMGSCALYKHWFLPCYSVEMRVFVALFIDAWAVYSANIHFNCYSEEIQDFVAECIDTWAVHSAHIQQLHCDMRRNQLLSVRRRVHVVLLCASARARTSAQAKVGVWGRGPLFCILLGWCAAVFYIGEHEGEIGVRASSNRRVGRLEVDCSCKKTLVRAFSCVSLCFLVCKYFVGRSYGRLTNCGSRK